MPKRSAQTTEIRCLACDGSNEGLLPVTGTVEENVMKVMVTCAALIATASVSQAQDGDGMGRGAGYSSCALYAKRYTEDPKMAGFVFFTWAQGYMTAANVALAAAGNRYHDLGGSIDDQEAHCSSHPTASYNDAVLDLYAILPLKARSR